jgi:SAM-dependent methyltransferase
MSSEHEKPDHPLGVITDAEEIAHYSDVATLPDKCRGLRSAVERVRELQTSWAVPLVSWLDSVPDCAAQADVYIHLSASIVGGRVLQIGGTGQAALKALAGGASEAVLVTPSPGEADLAREVASEFGFSNRFATAVGFAESLPVESGSVSAIISEGCMHHTNTEEAFRECTRVLVQGGRFGAWDPWKARLYTLGISIFGKRDPDVNCRPMDQVRLAELPTIFPTWSEVRLHGAMTRYPGIVWARFVTTPKVSTSYRMTLFDDRISRHFPALERNGSSCAILAVK